MPGQKKPEMQIMIPTLGSVFLKMPLIVWWLVALILGMVFCAIWVIFFTAITSKVKQQEEHRLTQTDDTEEPSKKA